MKWKNANTVIAALFLYAIIAVAISPSVWNVPDPYLWPLPLDNWDWWPIFIPGLIFALAASRMLVWVVSAILGNVLTLALYTFMIVTLFSMVGKV